VCDCVHLFGDEVHTHSCCRAQLVDSCSTAPKTKPDSSPPKPQTQPTPGKPPNPSPSRQRRRPRHDHRKLGALALRRVQLQQRAHPLGGGDHPRLPRGGGGADARVEGPKHLPQHVGGVGVAGELADEGVVKGEVLLWLVFCFGGGRRSVAWGDDAGATAAHATQRL